MVNHGAINGRLIALDGPRNGEWITGREAFADGYDIHRWPTGELVWAIGDPEEEPAELQASEPEPITIHVDVLLQPRVEYVEMTVTV